MSLKVITCYALECDYCGATYEVAEIEQLYREKEAASVKAQTKADADLHREKTAAEDMGMSWDAAEAAGMKAYNCPSCGAELICDATTAATSCPYCGNPTVVPGQFTGGLKPELVIPFKLDKEAAVAALKQYYKGKKQVDGSATYHARNTRTWKEGDYEITETDHYQVERSGRIAFERIPVDASTKMPDAHMDAIEPYDYNDIRAFSSAYLPGFLADRYDVSQQDSLPRIQNRAQTSAKVELRNTVKGYDAVATENEDYQFRKSGMKYALLPVWMLSTRWKDQNFLFAMNGQTGKLVGDLPVDKGKYLAWFAGIALPLMAAILGFWFFL